MKVEKLTEDQAVQGLAFPVEVKIYEEGDQVVPTSALITIKDGSGTALVEGATMVIEDGVGTLTYSLAAAKTADLIENGIIEITYIDPDSITNKAVFLFDVVLNKIKPVISDDDLQKYFPNIMDEIRDEQTTYDVQIQEAFRLVKRDIKDKGKRPHMILDGSQVRELLLLRTFMLIFLDFTKQRSDEDKWWVRYEEMKDAYKTALEGLLVKYDEDEDGIIDADERDKILSQPILER